MGITKLARFAGWIIFVLLFVNSTAAAAAGPRIETAPASGVAGYEMGIFGSGFGTAQRNSTVTVGGEEAPVLEWRDGMIRAAIPPVSDGPKTLVVKVGGASAIWPIVIYTINPAFTARVTDMERIGMEEGVYFTEPAVNAYIGGSPSPNLARNNVQFPGYLDCPPGQIFAVHLGQPLSEDVWWTMWGGTDGWPSFDGGGRATAYTIEGSRDSTDGVDGSWEELLAVTGSGRTSVVNKVSLAGHSWVRMRVTATLNSTNFRVYEIRVHRRAPGSPAGRIDSLGILGDSLTYGDFSPLLEEVYFPAMLARQRGSTAQIVHYPVGLVGAQAGILSAENTETFAFPRILTEVPDIDFWGFAFGTNDSLDVWGTQSYKENVRSGIEQVLARGKVPLIARLPDTGPQGFGSLENKLRILKAIDQLNAEYRLIPGPDLFTAFRKNILYEGMTYLNDDQTHHSGEGALIVQQLWAAALVQSGIYSGESAPPPAAAPAPPGWWFRPQYRLWGR